MEADCWLFHNHLAGGHNWSEYHAYVALSNVASLLEARSGGEGLRCPDQEEQSAD